MAKRLTLHLQIMSLRGLVFEDDVESVYVRSSQGEFEMLPFHDELLAALPAGEVYIQKMGSIPIEVGVVMFKNNTCTILAETAADVPMKVRWDDDEPKA